VSQDDLFEHGNESNADYVEQIDAEALFSHCIKEQAEARVEIAISLPIANKDWHLRQWVYDDRNICRIVILGGYSPEKIDYILKEIGVSINKPLQRLFTSLSKEPVPARSTIQLLKQDPLS